jgi:hypothetical protein
MILDWGFTISDWQKQVQDINKLRIKKASKNILLPKIIYDAAFQSRI